MYGKNDPIIIDALVDKIKSLKLTLSIKETEIEQLRKQLSNKEK